MDAVLWILLALAFLVAATGAGLAVYTARIARRVQAVLPPAGAFVAVPGGRIHYVEAGSGPPIVLIHGLGGNLYNFTHSLVGRLSHDYRLIAVDRPGAGYSLRLEDGTARLREQARMIHEFLKAKGIERPLVVGHSLGGAVALALALDYPQSVSGLALLAPLTRHEKQVPDMLKALAIGSPLRRRLVASTFAVPLSIRNRDRLLDAVFGPNRPPEDFPMRGGGLLSLRPKSFYTSSTDLMAVNDDLPAMEERYGELTMPVGIFFGTADRMLDYRKNGEAMRQVLPSLDFETRDGLGHMVPISAPDAAADFVRRMAGKAFKDGMAARPEE